jgi:large subunit ribosomal protein L2
MKLKKPSCFSNGSRHHINIQKNLLSKYNSIFKNTVFSKNHFSGRNNTGRITIRHRGGKKNKKKIGFFTNQNYYTIILNTFYNSNSTNFYNLAFDLQNKNFMRIPSTNKVFSGSLIESNINLLNLKLGSRSYLQRLPAGSLVSSITLAGKQKYARSAGTYGQILEKFSSFVKLKLPSGNFLIVSDREKATLGISDNVLHNLCVIGKAGRNRNMGIRPSVRGVAMNPVDHPHGGRSNKGMHPVTPWGLPTRNSPTSKKLISKKNKFIYEK